jgi:hypothetical protein
MRWILALIIIAVLAALLTFLVLRLSGSSDTGEDVVAEYFEAEDRYVNVDGMTFRVREEGRSDRPTLVMIHGFSIRSGPAMEVANARPRRGHIDDKPHRPGPNSAVYVGAQW